MVGSYLGAEPPVQSMGKGQNFHPLQGVSMLNVVPIGFLVQPSWSRSTSKAMFARGDNIFC